MQVKALLFARLQQEAGCAELDMELPGGSTVRDLAARLEAQYPLRLAGCMVAVNEAYSTPDQELGGGDEVAFLPPVAGGSGPQDTCTEITAEPLSLERAAHFLVRPECGAQVYFVGTVRSPNAGQDVQWIDYAGYAPLARRVMQEVAAEARARHGVRVFIQHRLGRLRPTEASLLVGVGSPHRRAALEACDLLVESLKAQLPVWKHEQGAGEAVWVPGQAAHPTL